MITLQNTNGLSYSTIMSKAKEINEVMANILDTSDCLEEATSRAEKMTNVFPMLTKEAVIEEIAIAPPALREKCLSTASWAKTSPAIGALKPAEIAAATPQPINIPGGNLFDVKFSKNVATVAPKCTKGPY